MSITILLVREPTGIVPGDPVIDLDLLCPSCGYNLRGLHEHRCPECGGSFDPAVLSETKLPWPHRRRIGRLRAYLQTAWMATFRPRQLAAQIIHPISYRDSQLFRWTTVFLAWLPLLFTTLYNWDGRGRILWVLPTGEQFGLATLLMCHTGSILALSAMTGVPSYFFQSARLTVEQQNRAIALSYYACAPLCTGLLFWPLGVVFQGLTELSSFGLAVLMSVLQMILWLRSLITLQKHGLEIGGPGRAIGLTAVIPFLWVALTGVVYVATTLAGMLLVGVWFSIRG